MSGVLTARGVTVRLGGTAIVRDASLALSAGELVALVGPNGAGKTTLMRALAGLVPAQGAIALTGRPLASLNPRERARAIAYLPQGHIFHWPMTVRVDCRAGACATRRCLLVRITGRPRGSGARTRHDRNHNLRAARRDDAIRRREARVALARALATQAPVLLADEPTAALDPRHQLIVMELLRTAAHGGNAILAIMHDLTLAARFADRVLVMNEGRIVADGAPAEALAPERLAAVFGIEATTVEVGNKRVPIAGRAL